jgi:hypothetical protein
MATSDPGRLTIVCCASAAKLAHWFPSSAWRCAVEPIRKFGDEFAHAEAGKPNGRDRVHTIMGAGDLAADGGGGVSVIAQIGRQQDGAVAGDLARRVVDQIGPQAIENANRNEVSIQCFRPIAGGEPNFEID